MKNTNILKSGKNYAGLQAPDGTTINIDGDGSLEANGGEGGAGIGGGMDGAGGKVTITNGTIYPGDIGYGMYGENCNELCYISGGSVYLERAFYIHTAPSASDDT